MSRLRLALAAGLAGGLLLTSSAVSASAATVQTAGCKSVYDWTTQATWGDRYKTWDGLDKINLLVGWKADVGNVESYWDISSYNSDGTLAKRYYAHGFYDFQGGSRFETFDIGDPTGPTPKVTVQIGIWDDKIPECSTTFALNAPTQTPTPTPSATPTASPTPSPTSSATPTATPSPSASPTTPGAVLFEDDFSGPAGTYDHSKWGEWSTQTYNGTAAYGNIKPGDRATVNGQGQLSIPATPTQGTSISTKDDFRFVYGTMTARIKVQAEAGYWPAFWSLNANPDGTKAPLVGEADALEAYTQYNDGYRSAAHNYDGKVADNVPHANPLCGNGKDIRGEWHDYSARIEPGKITFSLDGKVCWGFISDDADLLGDKPYSFAPDNPAGNWMLLTNAVGNSSQGMNPPTAPSVLLVDRVTVTSL